MLSTRMASMSARLVQRLIPGSSLLLCQTELVCSSTTSPAPSRLASVSLKILQLTPWVTTMNSHSHSHMAPIQWKMQPALPLTSAAAISPSPDAVAAGAELSGVTEVAVVDGEANFAELEVTGEVTGSQLMVSCSDADDFSHVGASGDFNVHRYPRTGNLKETNQKFSFKGDGQKLKNVIAAMGEFIQGAVAGVRK